MAISDTQKVDYLWKKVGYGAAKRDINSILNATQEGVPSPLLLRGENVWAQGNLIPEIIPGSSSGVVSVYTTGSPLEVSSYDTSARDYRSWNTGITDWIPPEFGSTYVVKVYVHTSGDAANASTSGTQLFGSGSGNNDEWFFDYQAGTLNFIGTNLPSGVNFSGKSIYISGAVYSGIQGVAVPGAANTFTSLSITDLTDNILGNPDTGAVQIDGGLGINKNVTIGAGLSIGSVLNVTGVSTFQGNVNLGDNDRLRFGDGNDLQIYHTGTDSVISDTGSGQLYLTADTGSGIYLTKLYSSTYLARFIADGAVELYYNNNKKFETTGAGVSISNGTSETATITAPENLIIDPAAVGDNTGVVRIKGDLYVDGTTTQINSTTIELADFIVGIATTATSDLLSDGAGIQIGPDNTFLYEYNGGTNPSLKSSENLNVTSGKVYQIDQTERLSANTLSLGTGTTIHSPAENTLLFGINNTETFRIATDGQIGIGTTDPTRELDIDGSIRIRDKIYDSNDSVGSVNYVLSSGGPGAPWSWQSVISVGATDSINIQDISDDQIQYILFSPTVGDVTGLAATTQGLVFNPSSRYIGIGLTTPTANLDVDGTATIRDDLNIGVGGTVALFDVSTGNIGVGTDNPTTKLQVGSASSPQVIGFGTADNGFGPSTNILIGDETTGSSLTPQADGDSSGINNTFIGAGAGKSTTTGYYNIFFGFQAGYYNITGEYNNFFGPLAGYCNTSGSYNNFLGGYFTGKCNTTGCHNFFVGSTAGCNNTTGSYNIFFGYQAGKYNSTGGDNIAIGRYSGQNFINVCGNTHVGRNTGGFYNNCGSFNSFFGWEAGARNREGWFVNAFGYQAGCRNACGCYNNYFGSRSGNCNTNGCYNNFFGTYNGCSSTASYKVVIGSGKFNYLFDSPDTTKDYQLAIGIRTDTNPSKYWVVGDENFNIGIGTTNPTSKLTVGGDVNVSGIITANQLSVSGISTDGVGFGSANYVITADGSGAWGWKSVVDTGAGTLDAIIVLDEGALVSTSGTATQLDFKGSNINAIGEDGSGIATVTFSDTPTFTSLNVTGSTGLGTTNPTAKLDVDGTVNVAGLSTFASNVDINADLDVDGRTELDATNISETLNVVGISTFLSDIDIDASIDVDGHTELDDLNVSGVSTFASSVDINADLDVDGRTELDTTNISETLNVVGLSTFGSNVDINADLDVDGFTELDATNISETLNVVGLSTFGSNVDINADLDVDGRTELDDLNVSGVSTFASNVDINTDLDVDGFTELDATNISETLNVIGLSTFGSDVDINASVDISTNLVVDGLSDLDELNVAGITTLNTDVEFVGPTAGITSAYWDSSENLLNFKDDVKATFGTGGDLQIYHTGSDSRIRDQGTGDLVIEGQNVNITNVQDGNSMIKGNAGGSADLYYDGDRKFGTTGIGVSIYNAGLSTATITGPSEIIIDPAIVGDNTGVVRIKGDLFVDGTQFTVDSGTIELADFVVGIATTVGNDSLLSGAGIGIGSESIQKTFLYEYNGGVSPSLKSSESLNVAIGKNYQINQIEVLNATTLGSGVTNSSLTSVGTLNELNVSGISTFQGNAYFGDNDVIYLGNSNDLEIRHNGTHSYIKDTGEGYLIFQTNNNFVAGQPGFIFEKTDGTDLAVFNVNSGIDLYHDGDLKFQTTGYGVSITGNIDVDNTTSIGSSTSSLSTLTQTAIHTELDIATYRSVEYTIQATEGTNFHATKILALHNGTTAYHSEYGTIFNNSSVASFDVDISGGNLRLLATGASASQTDYVVNFVATKV